MTNVVHLLGLRRTQRKVWEQPISSVRFDWIATALSGALVGGVYLDAWAHEHGRVDTSFFTPWHGILYSAMLVVMLFLLVPFTMNLLRGAAWRRALPVGYGLSLLGTLLFAVGGVGDMIWHILFGIEANLEALLSPTHLVLALGWFLIVGGPLRAAWQRTKEMEHYNWQSQLPSFLSLTFMLSVLTFFTIYATPFAHALAAVGAHAGRSQTAQALGVSGFLIQSALLMGAMLLVLQRWTLPHGTMTLVLTLNTALVSTLHDQYLLVAGTAVAGVVADLLYAHLQPSPARPGALRVWAFAVPVILYALYFLVLHLTTGIAWTVHLWTGALVLAGVVGLLLSYVAVPPLAPEQPDSRS
jgi:hypothetical protein